MKIRHLTKHVSDTAVWILWTYEDHSECLFGYFNSTCKQGVNHKQLSMNTEY